MKAKVLFGQYDDNSGTMIVRVYLEKDFEQAKRDLQLLQEHASDCKIWALKEVEVFGVD